VKLEWLVGLDAVDEAQAQEWIEKWLYRHFDPDFEHAKNAWIEGVDDLIARRRAEPRRNDVIDAVLYGHVAGRRLRDAEIRGVLMIMILGGFSATGDAVANIVLRLATYPELQAELRGERKPTLTVVDEFLRIEPPVTGIARTCVEDV